MASLNDVVLSVVKDFISNDMLFTALDVSNEVKKTMPFARHREVRDVVRSVFLSDIEPESYAKSTIQVTLPDSSTVDAILYHPLADTWDLDNKYDAQKRAQSTARPFSQTVQTTPTAPVVQTIVSPAQPAPVVVAPPTLSAKDAWANMFNSQPSLFPRR
jgi:hypothetical protein